jgi:hypothetical protein
MTFHFISTKLNEMMDAKQALSGAHLSAHSVKLAETAWSN